MVGEVVGSIITPCYVWNVIKKNQGMNRLEKYFESKVLPTLLRGSSKITTDISDVNKVIDNIKTSYLGKKDRGTNTRCKLMGLDFFYQISKLSDKERN